MAEFNMLGGDYYQEENYDAAASEAEEQEASSSIKLLPSLLSYWAQQPPLEEANDDNASSLYNYYSADESSCYIIHSPTECHDNDSCPPGWKLMLLIVYKIGRTYYAIPGCFLTTIFLSGMVVGHLLSKYGKSLINNWWWLWFSCRRNQQQYQHRHSKNGPSSQDSILKPLAASSTTTAADRSSRDDVDNEDDHDDNRIMKQPQRQSTSQEQREAQVRQSLLEEEEFLRPESGLSQSELPQHMAIIMDGNRRYGQQKYHSGQMGHWDGSRKLLQVANWCIAEGITTLTVYAFSTENWKRDKFEVELLWKLIVDYAQELQQEAKRRKIQITIISTDTDEIPISYKTILQELEDETRIPKNEQIKPKLQLNICLSYGSRHEIVQACQKIMDEEGTAVTNDNDNSRLAATTTTKRKIITVQDLESHLQLREAPDVIVRTAGETRLSNFLLWQCCYSELVFCQSYWPSLSRQDFTNILHEYAQRQRRYGR